MLMIATQLYFRLGAQPYGRVYLLGQQHQDSIVPCDAPFNSSNTDEQQIRYQRTGEIKYTARKNVSYCGYKNLIKVKGGFAANE